MKNIKSFVAAISLIFAGSAMAIDAPLFQCTNKNDQIAYVYRYGDDITYQFGKFKEQPQLVLNRKASQVTFDYNSAASVEVVTKQLTFTNKNTKYAIVYEVDEVNNIKPNYSVRVYQKGREISRINCINSTVMDYMNDDTMQGIPSAY